MYPGLYDRPKGEYLTDAITFKAEELIARAVHDKTPFFMNMAQFAVHTAIAPGPEKYLKHYKDGRPKVERDYGSMLTGMDASLGTILERLHDPNTDGDTADSIANNTVILFVSDNGGLSNHTREAEKKITLKGGISARFSQPPVQERQGKRLRWWHAYSHDCRLVRTEPTECFRKQEPENQSG